jgi:hypothetical protein
MAQIKMLKDLAQAIKILCVMVAAIYVLLIVAAELTCSIVPSIGNQCHGPDGDVWMAPFFLAPIGIPALIGSVVIFIIMAVRR